MRIASEMHLSSEYAENPSHALVWEKCLERFPGIAITNQLKYAWEISLKPIDQSRFPHDDHTMKKCHFFVKMVLNASFESIDTKCFNKCLRVTPFISSLIFREKNRGNFVTAFYDSTDVFIFASDGTDAFINLVSIDADDGKLMCAETLITDIIEAKNNLGKMKETLKCNSYATCAVTYPSMLQQLQRDTGTLITCAYMGDMSTTLSIYGHRKKVLRAIEKINDKISHCEKLCDSPGSSPLYRTKNLLSDIIKKTLAAIPEPNKQIDFICDDDFVHVPLTEHDNLKPKEDSYMFRPIFLDAANIARTTGGGVFDLGILYHIVCFFEKCGANKVVAVASATFDMLCGGTGRGASQSVRHLEMLPLLKSRDHWVSTLRSENDDLALLQLAFQDSGCIISRDKYRKETALFKNCDINLKRYLQQFRIPYALVNGVFTLFFQKNSVQCDWPIYEKRK